METLQRIQPLDILFVVLWAAIVGWGLQTGLVRQLGMLVGVYGACITRLVMLGSRLQNKLKLLISSCFAGVNASIEVLAQSELLSWKSPAEMRI